MIGKNFEFSVPITQISFSNLISPGRHGGIDGRRVDIDICWTPSYIAHVRTTGNCATFGPKLRIIFGENILFCCNTSIFTTILSLGVRLMVLAGLLLHGMDGVRCPGHHGPLFLHRLRQHWSLYLRDDTQVSAQHVRGVSGIGTNTIHHRSFIR